MGAIENMSRKRQKQEKFKTAEDDQAALNDNDDEEALLEDYHGETEQNVQDVDDESMSLVEVLIHKGAQTNRAVDIMAWHKEHCLCQCHFKYIRDVNGSYGQDQADDLADGLRSLHLIPALTAALATDKKPKRVFQRKPYSNTVEEERNVQFRMAMF
jgi:hypothetical protein